MHDGSWELEPSRSTALIVKYFKHQNKIQILEEIHGISSESVRRAMMLVNIKNKNVETTNWYKEIKQIDVEIQEFLLLE